MPYIRMIYYKVMFILEIKFCRIIEKNQEYAIQQIQLFSERFCRKYTCLIDGADNIKSILCATCKILYKQQNVRYFLQISYMYVGLNTCITDNNNYLIYLVSAVEKLCLLFSVTDKYYCFVLFITKLLTMYYIIYFQL